MSTFWIHTSSSSSPMVGFVSRSRDFDVVKEDEWACDLVEFIFGDANISIRRIEANDWLLSTVCGYKVTAMHLQSKIKIINRFVIKTWFHWMHFFIELWGRISYWWFLWNEMLRYVYACTNLPVYYWRIFFFFGFCVLQSRKKFIFV